MLEIFKNIQYAIAGVDGNYTISQQFDFYPHVTSNASSFRIVTVFSNAILHNLYTIFPWGFMEYNPCVINNRSYADLTFSLNIICC